MTSVLIIPIGRWACEKRLRNCLFFSFSLKRAPAAPRHHTSLVSSAKHLPSVKTIKWIGRFEKDRQEDRVRPSPSLHSVVELSMEGSILSLRVHCSVTANDSLLRSRRGSVLAAFQTLLLLLSPKCAVQYSACKSTMTSCTFPSTKRSK